MHPFPIVAVASSTRDFEAVVELLSALPATYSAALVIAQHFDPGRRDGSLHDALTKRSSRPVVIAHDGIVLEPGHVYVMRAGDAPTIIGDCLSVSPAASVLQGPADGLFTSLAADRGNTSIGIVLSGVGSDGAVGIQAIRKAGGTTFAQYPGSARFPGMPISAIETGCVTSVSRPNEIAHELTRMSHLATRPRTLHAPVSLTGVVAVSC